MYRLTEFLLTAIVLSALSGLALAKILGKCSLARTLRHYGVPYHELSDWMCLIEGESSFDTKAVNPSNADGSMDWGLFQINDRYWCKPADGRPSKNLCRLPCRLLLSDDLRYAIACARYIRRVQGFSAWVAWNNRCQDRKRINSIRSGAKWCGSSRKL